MPQITVDYSDTLAESFDRTGFGTALHALVVETAGARTEACKTRFCRADDTVVGDSTSGHAVLHIGIGLLAGRTDEVKAQLTERTLDLVRSHVKPVDGLVLHVSAEIRDLDGSYRKSE